MKFYLMTLFLLLTAIGGLAQTETEIVGTVSTINGEPLSGVEVKVIGRGRATTTTSGEFRITLPISRVGQKITLQAYKKDWVTINLDIIVPADPIQNSIRLTMKKSMRGRRSPSDPAKSSRGARKTPEKRPASSSDKTIILVADFHSLEEKNIAVTETIISQLRNATSEYSDDIEVLSLKKNITAQEGSAVARAKGKEYRADIVLWGWYSQSKENIFIDAHFEDLQNLQLLPLRQDKQPLMFPVSELESFRVQILLSNQMSYLTLLTVGLARLGDLDYDGALDLFTRALNLSSVPDHVPDHMVDPADLYFFRGITYFLKGAFYSRENLNRAIDDLNQAIKLNDRHAAALLIRASAYSTKNDYDRAILDYNRAIALDPKNACAYVGRGFVHLAKDDPNRANADFDQARQLSSGEPYDFFQDYVQAMIFLMKQNFDQSILKFTQLIKLNPEPTLLPLLFLMRGGVYICKGDSVRALADFDRCVKPNPKLPIAYWARGLLFAEEKEDYERAIAEYTKAINLDPTFAEAYKERGYAFRQRAIAEYIEAIKLDPTFGQRPVYDKAIADYDKAISLNPDDPETYYRRGLTYELKGDMDRSFSDYNQAIKLKPDYPYPYYYRARVYERKGDIGRAIDDINQYIELMPRDEDGYASRGFFYESKGNWDCAISDYDQAIKLKADYLYSYFRRSYVYWRKGDLGRSIADLNQCIRINPNDAGAYFNRGMSYADNGDRFLAIADLKKAIELTKNPQLRLQAEQKLQQLGVK